MCPALLIINLEEGSSRSGSGAWRRGRPSSPRPGISTLGQILILLACTCTVGTGSRAAGSRGLSILAAASPAPASNLKIFIFFFYLIIYIKNFLQ